MVGDADVFTRKAAFRVVVGCPSLIIDLNTNGVVSILQKELQDPQSAEVSHSPCTIILLFHLFPPRTLKFPVVFLFDTPILYLLSFSSIIPL